MGAFVLNTAIVIGGLAYVFVPLLSLPPGELKDTRWRRPLHGPIAAGATPRIFDATFSTPFMCAPQIVLRFASSRDFHAAIAEAQGGLYSPSSLEVRVMRRIGDTTQSTVLKPWRYLSSDRFEVYFRDDYGVLERRGARTFEVSISARVDMLIEHIDYLCVADG